MPTSSTRPAFYRPPTPHPRAGLQDPWAPLPLLVRDDEPEAVGAPGTPPGAASVASHRVDLSIGLQPPSPTTPRPRTTMASASDRVTGADAASLWVHPAEPKVDEQVQVVLMTAQEVCRISQEMEDKHYSFVCATPEGAFHIKLCFEQAVNIFRIIVDADPQTHMRKDAKMKKAKWRYWTSERFDNLDCCCRAYIR